MVFGSVVELALQKYKTNGQKMAIIGMFTLQLHKHSDETGSAGLTWIHSAMAAFENQFGSVAVIQLLVPGLSPLFKSGLLEDWRFWLVSILEFARCFLVSSHSFVLQRVFVTSLPPQ